MQAPSTVNNCAREMMSSIRTQWDDAVWFNFYPTTSTSTYVSLKAQNKIRISQQSAATTYTATDIYPIGTRLKINNLNTNKYGSVASLSSSSTAVILTMTMDSGTLTNTITTVSRSIITPGSNTPIPASAVPGSGTYAVQQNGSPIYGADAGATDDYAITLSPAPSSYVAGMTVRFKANTQNTTGATLNVNGLGAVAILKFHDQVLATGDIEAGQISTVTYDGTNWQLQSAVAIAPGAGTVTSVATAGLATGGPITGTGTVTVTAATQAEMEAGTSGTVVLTPAVAKYFPGTAKFYLMADTVGGIVVSYNITSVTDAGTGDIDVTIATDFSSSNYVITGLGRKDATTTSYGYVTIDEVSAPTAGTFSAWFAYNSTTLIDPNSWLFSGFGTQV